MPALSPTAPPPVEFGMAVGRGDDVIEVARRLERLGYDYVTAGDHVAFNVPTPSAFVTLAAAAGATERVRLHAAALLLPLYPAVLAAKFAATLDALSGGRLSLGVGVGGEYPREFEAAGVPLEERGARCDEAIDIMRRCWTEHEVCYTGRFATLDRITIEPKPVQQPHPPVWVAGRKAPAIRRAARLGDGWMPYLFSPDRLADSAAMLARECRDVGRAPAEVRIGAFVFIVCHRDPSVARRHAAESLGRQYRQDFDGAIDRHAVAGSAEDCRRRLAEYVDAGATAIFLSSSGPQHYRDENQRRIAEDVIPGVREHISAARS